MRTMWASSRLARNPMSAAVTAAKNASHNNHVCRRSAPLLELKPITNTRLRDNHCRSHRVVLDFSAKIRNVHAKVGLRITSRISPHGSKNLVVGHGPPGMCEERTQEIPFDRRQVDLFTIAAQSAPGWINRKTACRDHGRSVGQFSSAHIRTHTRA